METDQPTLTAAEAEELAALLATIEGGANSDVPQNIQELLRNVKRHKGDKGDEPQGEEVVPESGFVVKTFDQHRRKVFLNICASPKVEAPAGVANGQLPDELLQALDRLDADGNKLTDADMESLRIPLSCGEPRDDMDNKGGPCTTVDVVFNLDVVRQAAAVRSLKYFVIQIATGWVAQKFGMQLDPKYKLPKMRYKGGTVQPQRMRTVRKPLVKDMGEVPEDPVFPLVTQKLAPKLQPAAAQPAAGGSTGQLPAESTASPQAAHAAGQGGGTVARKLESSVGFEGNPVAAVLVMVSLPHDRGEGGVQVECHSQQLLVSVRGCSPLQVTLPFAVAAAEAVAVVEASALKVRLPVRPLRELVEELRSAAPHALGSLKLVNSACLELD